MYFRYDVSEKLPRLAWCAIFTEGKDEILVKTGKHVERFTKFFVEGAWDGPFAEGNFKQSTLFCGSGIYLEEYGNGGALAVGPSHTLERLVSLRKEHHLYISNSLPFLLAEGNGKCVYAHDYLADFYSILSGLDHYQREVPLKHGLVFRQHVMQNLFINHSLEIKEISKKEIDPFVDYEDYLYRLRTAVSHLILNAGDAERMVTYGLVSTISKGYDSPAAAAIARECGCNQVVTFGAPLKYSRDCGADIAKKLGYTNIVIRDAAAYLENKELLECEALCSGELGSELELVNFRDVFSGNIVFTGGRGDFIWGKDAALANERCVFPGASLSFSHLETRLKAGYIYLPVPCYGVTKWPSIAAITNAPEMQPYTIGGDYDRPISRRILEERGVPRNWFGMEKHGFGFNYCYDPVQRIKKRMSPYSYQVFSQYYHTHKALRQRAHYKNFAAMGKMLPIYINRILAAFQIKKRLPVSCQVLVSPGAASWLFFWAMDEMVERYRRKERTVDDEYPDFKLRDQEENCTVF